jgi:predicted dienelactone hydrolase
VLSDNVDPSSWLYHLVDARRVGAVGHSMGAWTVLALVGNSCCRDPRVKAAVIDAGEMVPAFNSMFFTHGSAPVLFVNVRDDPTVPYAAGEQAYLSAPKPKYMLTLPSGGHITPYFGPKTPVGATVLQVTNDFLDRYVRTIRSVAITSPDLRYGTLVHRI